MSETVPCTGACGKEMPARAPRCADCLEGASILNALAERGKGAREDERKQIVEWLRSAEWAGDSAAKSFATMIERGDHQK